MNKIGILFGFICMCSMVGMAQVNAESTYKFLNLPTSARSASMGGSFISSGTHDLNLVADNPAILDSTMHNLATISYINYITDVNMGYVAHSRHFDNVGTFSAGLQFMGYGEFTRADPTGVTYGTFKAGDYAFDISYGRPIDSLFAIGASMKLVYSQYDFLNSFGVAFDVGATYTSKNKLFHMGAVLNNMGWELKSYHPGEGQNLPFNAQLAASIKLDKAPLRFTVMANNLQQFNMIGHSSVDGLPTLSQGGTNIATASDNPWTADNIIRHFVVGAEIVPNKNFFVQIAYNFQRRAELSVPDRTSLNAFSIGTGFKIKRLKFSYALASYAAAATSHHITLSTDLKQFNL